jgi:hypothetical protein
MSARSTATRSGAPVVALVIGLGVFAAAMILGADGRVLELVVAPPAIVRSLLVAVSVVGGLVLLRRALVRLSAAQGAEPDIPGTLRGIRLVFLAVAAFAAAAGWLLASPMPLLVALVIAAVDIVETSFLLLVVSRHRDR